MFVINQWERLKTATPKAVLFSATLAAVLVLCWGVVAGTGEEVARNIGGDHFRLFVPADFQLFTVPGDLTIDAGDSPWERVVKKRLQDLDVLYYTRQDRGTVYVGLKRDHYRRRLRRALSFGEFAGPNDIDLYKQMVAGQLIIHGLRQVEVRHRQSDPEEGVITFMSVFKQASGQEGGEYYASFLGSREIVYLVVFSDPPAPPGIHEALFNSLVSAFSFHSGYGYDHTPGNWWQRRTWAERIEDVTKLGALFFLIYMACSWGVSSLAGKLVSSPWAMRAIVLLVTSGVFLLIANWTLFG